MFSSEWAKRDEKRPLNSDQGGSLESWGTRSVASPPCFRACGHHSATSSRGPVGSKQQSAPNSRWASVRGREPALEAWFPSQLSLKGTLSSFSFLTDQTALQSGRPTWLLTEILLLTAGEGMEANIIYPLVSFCRDMGDRAAMGYLVGRASALAS